MIWYYLFIQYSVSVNQSQSYRPLGSRCSTGSYHIHRFPPFIQPSNQHGFVLFQVFSFLLITAIELVNVSCPNIGRVQVNVKVYPIFAEFDMKGSSNLGPWHAGAGELCASTIVFMVTSWLVLASLALWLQIFFRHASLAGFIGGQKRIHGQLKLSR